MASPRYVYSWNGELDVKSDLSHSAGASTSTVFRGSRVGVDVALKRVPRQLVNAKALDFNISLSAAMQNEQRFRGADVHVLKVFTCQSGRPSDADALYIALEECDYNIAHAVQLTKDYLATLRDLEELPSFDEDAAPLLLWRARRSVSRQLLAAVAFLHSGRTPPFRRVYHYNLKPNNVLLKNGVVKLSEVSFYAQPSVLAAWAVVPDEGGTPPGQGQDTTSTAGAPHGADRGRGAALVADDCELSGTCPIPERDAVSEWAPRRVRSDELEEEQLLRLLERYGFKDDHESMLRSQQPPWNTKRVEGLEGITSVAQALKRLYRLRAYQDSFATACLIYYVLTLGGHPLGALSEGAPPPLAVRSSGACAGAGSMASPQPTSKLSSSHGVNAGYANTSNGSRANLSVLSAMKRRTQPDTAHLTASLQASAASAARQTERVAEALENGALRVLRDLQSHPVSSSVLKLSGLKLNNLMDAEARKSYSSSSAVSERLNRSGGDAEDVSMAVETPNIGLSVDVPDAAMATALPTVLHGHTGDSGGEYSGESSSEEEGECADLDEGPGSLPGHRGGDVGAARGEEGPSPGPDDLPDVIVSDPRASHSFSSDGLLASKPKGLSAVSVSPGTAIELGGANGQAYGHGGGGGMGISVKTSASGLLQAMRSSTKLSSIVAAVTAAEALASSAQKKSGTAATSASKEVDTDSSGVTTDAPSILRQVGSVSDMNKAHHQHYASLADTVDWAEAADLVLGLMRPDHGLRMLPADALSHPFFWSTSRKFMLITLASEATVVDRDRAKGKHAVFASAIQRAFLPHLPPHGKWSLTFPAPPGMGSQGWDNPAWFHRDPMSYEEVYAGPYSCYGLVRYVRNMWVHGPAHIRDGLFPSQAHLEAHALGAYPWLVLELWKVDREVNGGRFTAQALSGGTALAVVGDAGVDAEYDVFEYGHVPANSASHGGTSAVSAATGHLGEPSASIAPAAAPVPTVRAPAATVTAPHQQQQQQQQQAGVQGQGQGQHRPYKGRRGNRERRYASGGGGGPPPLPAMPMPMPMPPQQGRSVIYVPTGWSGARGGGGAPYYPHDGPSGYPRGGGGGGPRGGGGVRRRPRKGSEGYGSQDQEDARDYRGHGAGAGRGGY